MPAQGYEISSFQVRNILYSVLVPFQMLRIIRRSSSKLRKEKRKPLRDGSKSWVECASALKLSCMWQMTKVQEMAVQTILELQNQADTECQKSLLRLSNKLRITKIRDRAIEILSEAAVEPVEWIQRGMKFQVDSWLLGGYQQLIQASDGISVEHEELLGQKTTSKLFRIRDAYLQHNPLFSAPINAVTAQIKEAFSEELEAAIWVGN
jgi:hypothetical protein